MVKLVSFRFLTIRNSPFFDDANMVVSVKKNYCWLITSYALPPKSSSPYSIYSKEGNPLIILKKKIAPKKKSQHTDELFNYMHI